MCCWPFLSCKLFYCRAESPPTWRTSRRWSTQESSQSWAYKNMSIRDEDEEDRKQGRREHFPHHRDMTPRRGILRERQQDTRPAGFEPLQRNPGVTGTLSNAWRHCTLTDISYQWPLRMFRIFSRKLQAMAVRGQCVTLPLELHTLCLLSRRCRSGCRYSRPQVQAGPVILCWRLFLHQRTLLLSAYQAPLSYPA